MDVWADGGGSAEVLAADADEDFPPFCDQPPASQMEKYRSLLLGIDWQDSGHHLAGDAQMDPRASQLCESGALQGQQGSEGASGEEETSASQQEGSGAAQRQQQSSSGNEQRYSLLQPAGLQHLTWLFKQHPKDPAMPDGLLAGRESLATLPGTPRLLAFALRAMLEVRGDPSTREIPPASQLPMDQDSSQCRGISQDRYVSQSELPANDLAVSMGADAGDGYYLFRTAAQAQLDELWLLAVQLANQLAETTLALERQQAAAEQRDGTPACKAQAVEQREALLRCQRELEAALADREQLLAATQDKLEQASKAAGEREAELQSQLEEANQLSAELEAQLQQQVEQAAVREAGLRQQVQQAVQRKVKLQQNVLGVTATAAKREADLQQRLEHAAEAAAAQEAKLQEQVQQAQQAAQQEGEECRRLRQQLAQLQRTRQQELAEADEQQEAAAAERQHLASEVECWKARCQALQQQAAQSATVAADSQQTAVERDAAMAECHRLRQELATAQRLAATLQHQNAALQVSRADVLAKVQQAAAAAEAHTQEAEAAAYEGGAPSIAVPTSEPEVACTGLSWEQQRELKRLLTDNNYQHTKLGAAFMPLQALRSTSFWRAVTECLQAPQQLAREEGARMLAETALSGQQAAEAALRKVQRSERLALKQAKRMIAVVEGAQRTAAAHQAAAKQGVSGAVNGGQQPWELHCGYNMWDLLVELAQQEAQLLEVQKELEREQEASSCKAWKMLYEAEEARKAACQRVHYLEAQLAEIQGLVQRLREVAKARLCCREEVRAAKKARHTVASSALAGGRTLGALGGSHDLPAGSKAEKAATAAAGETHEAAQGCLADPAEKSGAVPAASTTAALLQLEDQQKVADQPVGMEIEPVAAAAQLQHDEQAVAAGLLTKGGQTEPSAAVSGSRMRPLQCEVLQGRPPRWQQYLTPQLIARHGAFASLMAQALARQDPSSGGCNAQQDGSNG